MTVKTQYISIFAFALAITAFFGPSFANKAEAFEPIRLIDPFCIFSDCDEEQVIYQTINTNTNSNVNSPGGVVNVNTGSTSGGNGGNGGGYDDDWTRPLDASCSPSTTVADTDERVTWYGYGYGGTGSYTYEWDGDEGLDGTGSSQTIRYDREGSKSAEITVRSGGKSITKRCTQEVRVYEDDDYDRDYDDDRYDHDRDYDYYGPLAVSCSVNTTFAQAGTVVTWSAYVSGGNGYYSYRWDGTDGLRGSGSSVSYLYGDAGQKRAEVRVTSGGRSVTRSCSNTVTVGVPVSQVQPVPVYGQGGTIQAACFADRVSAGAGSTINWAVEASGGNGVYTYTWSGSDGLSGYGQYVSKTYNSSGSKTAYVTVTSGAESKSISCGNSVAIGGYYGGSNGGGNGGKEIVKPASAGLFAAALFSLSNVPWGWVAVLVILVLFTMVMYLLFNKSKI